MSNPTNDWIRIAIKFRGKCAVCSGEIATGEVALWSRNGKAIKHISCPQKGGTSKGDKLPGSSDKSEINCFVCGRIASCNTNDMVYNSEVTPTLSRICDDCIAGNNAYERYQEAFQLKMRRIGNLKI